MFHEVIVCIVSASYSKGYIFSVSIFVSDGSKQHHTNDVYHKTAILYSTQQYDPQTWQHP